MKGRILLSVIMSTVLLLVPCVFAQGPNRDAPGAFQKALTKDGFDVTPGVAAVWNPVVEWCEGRMADTFCANIGLYLLLQVPKSKEDPIALPDLISEFKLRQDEAIVLFGRTPPPVKYFGFYTFISTRFYPDREEGDERVAGIGSTVGDAVNNATIKTTGPTPYDSPFALIVTPNQSTNASIRKALKRAGYHEGAINTYPLPASMLNLGHGPYADEFKITLRTAWFDDPIAGEAYINNAPKDLHLFRVTPRATAGPNPFPVPPLRVRGTGETEMRLMNKLGELRQGIIDAHPELHATDHRATLTCYEDNDLLQREIQCLGGTRDAFIISAGWIPGWGNSYDPITLEDDEFLMFYGVNHVLTGKATYMSINAYATGQDEGGSEPVSVGGVNVGAVYDNDLKGTAAGYLPGDPDAKLMYAYKVSRNCAKGEPCLPLSAPCAALTLDSKTVLGFLVRMYLEPATKVGAAMQEILYDRVIKFSPGP